MLTFIIKINKKTYFLFFLQIVDIISRSRLDTANFWTMVYNQPFSFSGQIQTVEVFAGATGRGLKLGIHRPEGSGACNFRLVQEYVVDSVPVGRSTVRHARTK